MSDRAYRVPSPAARRLRRLAVAAAGAAAVLAPVAARRADAHNSITPPTGLVAWYRGQGDASDTIGGNDGTIQGAVRFATGEVDVALQFDGAGAYVDVPVTPALDFDEGDFTIEGWVSFDDLTRDQTIFQKVSGTTAADPTYLLEFVEPDSLRFAVVGAGGNANDLVATADLIVGRFHHLAAVRSGDTSRIFVDGFLIGEQTAGTSVATGTGGSARIGRRADDSAAAEFFAGRVDELSLYSRALPEPEIDAIVVAGAAGKSVPAVDSFIVPSKVRFAPNATKPEKSRLTASGVLDTGSQVADLAAAATLDVGGVSVAVPQLVRKRSGYVLSAEGLTFTVKPSPIGSSRATFKLKIVGDLTGKVAADGPLDLHFVQGPTDASCRVNLAEGKFVLGKSRGALVTPLIWVSKVSAKISGAGVDSLTLVMGLATHGVTPLAAGDAEVRFGPTYVNTVPKSLFMRTGDQFRSSPDSLAYPYVVVDYAAETATITGKGLSLGQFAEGASKVDVAFGFGEGHKTVSVRLVKRGLKLKY